MFDSWGIIEMGNYSVDVNNTTDLAFMSMLMRFVATGTKSGASFDLIAQYISIYERMRLVDLTVIDAKLLVDFAAIQRVDSGTRAFIALYEVYRIQGQTAVLKPHVLRTTSALLNVYTRLENRGTVSCPSYIFTGPRMPTDFEPRLSAFIRQDRINNRWNNVMRVNLLRAGFGYGSLDNSPNMIKAYDSVRSRGINYLTAARFIDARPAADRVWR
uniref:VP11 n=1 Tax=Callinectes sapidus reovirus 2 TaxID=2789658 RepID=A0A8K1HQ94_9REOV|nr:VP11 [Callinectes sapidus reovirus 2]